MTVAVDAAQFRDVESALQWLFRPRNGTYERSSLADLIGGPSAPGNSLGGLDGAGTAGMIGAKLATLPQLWRRLLIARFSVPSAECLCMRRCCRGWDYTPAWSLEIAWISATVMLDISAPKLRNKPNLRESLVMRYCGVGRTLKKIAAENGVHTNTAAEYFDQIKTILGKEEKQAYAAIDERLRNAGIVGD